jgi:phage terminase large subunit
MDQDTTVFKLLDSLNQFIDLDETQIQAIVDHLHMAYAVGYDLGRTRSQRRIVKEVIQYDRLGNLVHSYPNRNRCAKILKIAPAYLSKVIKEKILYKGFVWKYA